MIFNFSMYKPMHRQIDRKTGLIEKQYKHVVITLKSEHSFPLPPTLSPALFSFNKALNSSLIQMTLSFSNCSLN